MFFKQLDLEYWQVYLLEVHIKLLGYFTMTDCKDNFKCCFCNCECEKKGDIYFCDICNCEWTDKHYLIEKSVKDKTIISTKRITFEI